MKAGDPNVAKVELIANALGPLRDELIFVGGCAAGLLLTEEAAAPARVTYDVDLVAQVAALSDYHRLEKRFAELGFKRDTAKDAPICRWRFNNLEVDLMATDSRVLGFSNRWYPFVAQTAQEHTLPSGANIRLITAPAFLATKFEAFTDRGHGDLLGSRDVEDIINVVEGRPQLVDEIARVPAGLQSYLADRCRMLLAMPNFMSYLPGLMLPDESLAERVSLTAQRLHQIAGIRPA